MLEVHLKPEARIDLEKIYKFTLRNWCLLQADDYQDDLFSGMQLLARRETLGKEYQFAHILYKKLHVKRHLIFYRIEATCLIIVRILHDSLDVSKRI